MIINLTHGEQTILVDLIIIPEIITGYKICIIFVKNKYIWFYYLGET